MQYIINAVDQVGSKFKIGPFKTQFGAEIWAHMNLRKDIEWDIEKLRDPSCEVDGAVW